MAGSTQNGDSPKKKRNLTPEQREKKRQNMLKLREQGKVGPQYGKLGGRPKKPRATELLAQEAEKHKNELLQVLKDGIDGSQNMSTRLRALEQWLKIEGDERRQEIEEEKHEAEMSRDELMATFAQKINSNPLLKDMFMKAMSGQGPGLVERVPNLEDYEGDGEEVLDESE